MILACVCLLVALALYVRACVFTRKLLNPRDRYLWENYAPSFLFDRGRWMTALRFYLGSKQILALGLGAPQKCGGYTPPLSLMVVIGLRPDCTGGLKANWERHFYFGRKWQYKASWLENQLYSLQSWLIWKSPIWAK